MSFVWFDFMFYYRVDDVLLFLFCFACVVGARQGSLNYTKKAAVTHIAISQGYALHANNPRATHTYPLGGI